MEEFTAELRARLREARRELRRARENGDEYDVQVVSGRLDTLERLATEHGIDPAGDEA
ncbi:hypothetical protein GCM10009530_27350 [Microbispora corallina]|uniref:Uncharacterized protein n=1 Tax=Microbispora corallina TaxID=83302 RepID=A0ABQ4FZ93_9ACTN|nr:hypothetical protein [Microbispora corallina]GIH40120.1 hypothetical protein Mco01_31200 [Microbispora corallina]